MSQDVFAEARRCTLCTGLPLPWRPIFQADSRAKILIAGQAPGQRTHHSGVPFDDPSGQRLRAWMGLEKEEFYDPTKVAILPMGFCFPGTGKSGDLPPRPECAPKWRKPMLSQLQNISLTLIIGRYAMDYHLPERRQQTLTTTVEQWQDFWPSQLPLPHPSPRNNRWLSRNPFFERDVIPELRSRVARLLTESPS